VVAATDARISKPVGFISKHAREKITAGDVLRAVPMSRTLPMVPYCLAWSWPTKNHKSKTQKRIAKAEEGA
jgi:hypothetical protein